MHRKLIWGGQDKGEKTEYNQMFEWINDIKKYWKDSKKTPCQHTPKHTKSNTQGDTKLENTRS